MKNQMKTISPVQCPHCAGDLYVEFATPAPELSSIYTQDEMMAAKKEVVNRIAASQLDDSVKDNIINWVEDEETIFGPSEIDIILDSAMKEYL